MLDLCEEPIDNIRPEDCLLCCDWASSINTRELAANPKAKPGILVVTPLQFRRHLAAHLEQLALFALPRNHGGEDASKIDSNDAVVDASSDDISILDVAADGSDSLENGEEDHPLYLAAASGQVDDVRKLLEAGADANARGKNHDSALQAAARLGFDFIAKLLIEHGADVNSPAGPNGTAIRIARSQGHGNIVDLLLKSGADSTDGNLIHQRSTSRQDSIDKGKPQAVNRGEDPTTAEFVEKVDGLVKDSPMERFFEGKEDFIQEVAKNAVELENDTSTSLGCPDVLPKTIKVSLHQQVIYCGKRLEIGNSNTMTTSCSFDSDKDGIDDSASMRREDRWESQKILVERITKITTRVLPEGEGVALRFINREVPNSSNLRLGDIENIFKSMKWGPRGNTEIGTNLRSKILKPLVYDKLDSASKNLERPLLISILTDGAPAVEPEAMLKNAILECSQKLNDAQYPRESEYPYSTCASC